MSNIDKQWLQQKIAGMEAARDEIPFGLDEDDSNTLAALRIALASLETEAVGYMDAEYAQLLKSWHIESCSVYAEQGEGCIALYAAPPAPVVPEEMPKSLAGQIVSLLAHNIGDKFLAQKIWNACREAMLQGAEPVTKAYKLPEGWVAVPVEPTEDMIVNGFESEPDESFSDADVWEAYESMSGCQQAAHRAKLCWAAMISAAPKV